MNKIIELLLRDARENYIRRDAGASWKDAPCQICDLAWQEYLFIRNHKERKRKMKELTSEFVKSYYCINKECLCCPIKKLLKQPCAKKGAELLKAMENYFDE